MKSSIRNFAFRTSLVAITLSGMPRNAAALMRASGDKPVKIHVQPQPRRPPRPPTRS